MTEVAYEVQHQPSGFDAESSESSGFITEELVLSYGSDQNRSWTH
jgi:hypothetical protein